VLDLGPHPRLGLVLRPLHLVDPILVAVAAVGEILRLRRGVADRRAAGRAGLLVGSARKSRLTADLATDALTMGWFRRRPAPGVLHHSDRGSQCASQACQDRLTGPMA